MVSRTFLVDTENVASTWLSILPEMTPRDSLLIFYTRNSPGVAYTDLMHIMQYVGRFECVECYPGANGLDFQLVSYLGYLLRTAPKSQYIIVSRDTGYDAVCKFWTDRDRSVIRKAHVEPETAAPAAAVAPVRPVEALSPVSRPVTAEMIVPVSRLELTRVPVAAGVIAPVAPAQPVRTAVAVAEPAPATLAAVREEPKPAVKVAAPASNPVQAAPAKPTDVKPGPVKAAPAAKPVVQPVRPAVPEHQMPLSARIACVLNGVATPEETRQVSECFGDGTAVDQGQIHNSLVDRLGAVRGREFYNLLKPVFRSCAHKPEAAKPTPAESKPAEKPRQSATSRRRGNRPVRAAAAKTEGVTENAAPAAQTPAAPVRNSAAEAVPAKTMAENTASATPSAEPKPAVKTAEVSHEAAITAPAVKPVPAPAVSAPAAAFPAASAATATAEEKPNKMVRPRRVAAKPKPKKISKPEDEFVD